MLLHFWKVSSNDLNVDIITLVSPIKFSNIALEGFYDLHFQYFKVSDLNLDLLSEDQLSVISFSGGGEAYHINENFISKLNVNLKTPFSHDILYQYLPKNISSDLNEQIKTTVKQGIIKKANFNFEYQSVIKKNQMKLNVQIDDIMLTPKIKNTEHKVDIASILLDTDMKSMNLLTNSAKLDDMLEMRNINIFVPFTSSKHKESSSIPITSISLGIDTEIKDLENWYNKYLNTETEKVWSFKKGNSKTKISLGIPPFESNSNST